VPSAVIACTHLNDSTHAGSTPPSEVECVITNEDTLFVRILLIEAWNRLNTSDRKSFAASAPLCP